jgi:hypothetical protein
MKPISAESGLRWMLQGWRYFAQQPGVLLSLCLGNIFIMLLLSVIPLLGRFLPLLLTPVCSMAIMSACALIASQQALQPGLLLIGFRSPALMRLLRLGMLYSAAFIAVLMLANWISDGQFWQLLQGKLKPAPGSAAPPGLVYGMIAAMVGYIVVATLFWFTAPLVMWQGMSPGKALFYNFFAVWRARSAFLVFALTWATLGMFLPIFVISVLGRMLGNPSLAMFMALAASVLIKVALECSCFASYQQIFGEPKSITSSS